MLPKMQYCKLHPFKIVILVTRGSIFVVWDQFHTTIHNTFEMCLVSSKYLRASKWAYQVFIIKKHLKWKSSNHGHFLHQAHFKHNVNSLHGINFEFFLKNHYFCKKFDKITCRHSSWGTRNRGIWWQGIPREENRRGKRGIGRSKKVPF